MEKVIIIPFEKCCDDSKSRKNVLARGHLFQITINLACFAPAGRLIGDLSYDLSDNS
jgi:hypothetical protein